MKSLAIVLVCLVIVACDDYRVPLPFPTSPTTTVGATPAPTLPRDGLGDRGVFPPRVSDYTTIGVGETVSRRVVNPPNCFGYPWPCQYFRLATTSAGRLTVEVTFDPATQPGQGLDLTLEDAAGREVWADHFEARSARVSARITDAAEIQITVLYTHPGLQFELRTSFEPN